MILVTGASGFVGGHVVRRLLQTAGTEVRAMVRDRSKASNLIGAEVVQADLNRSETLAAAVSEASAIIHTAALTANLKEPYRGAYERINRVGTENLIAAATSAGVTRLVVMSGLGTKPAPAGSYMATRWGLEEAVRKGGIPYVILQPSVLFGEGAEFIAALSRLARVSPVLPVLGSGKIRFQPLWVEDLVTCLVKSLDAVGLTGSAIPLGGSEYATFREVLQTICEDMSIRRLMVPLPLPVARMQARVMTAILSSPPLTPASTELFSFDNATELDAVDRNFGFHPRGFREHLKAQGVGG